MKDKQPGLWDAPIGAIDPHALATDKPRLTGQNLEILTLLRAGPKTNTELAAVALKYTSRLSDIRAAGYAITCKRLDGGLTLYTLEK